MEAKKQKVLVGMSGGVDSSVTAALLLRDGYEVVGGYMKNWSDETDECTGSCGWQDERRDALAVAAKLGIPFHTFDFEAEYRERVIGYMVREYAAGRTPNPDVMCNREIKFDLFLRAADDLGADFVATGHYARVRKEGEEFELLAGVDENKDQSYFLHRLSQAQLSRALFPVGELRKPEVRELAREFGLPTSEKKDSQGICFVGQVDLKDFLADKLEQKPGPIETADGKVIGQHAGIAPFTVGQRQGLGIGGGDPYFVVRKDMERNALIVAPASDDSMLWTRGAKMTDMHWISGTSPELPLSCMARIRYRQPLQNVEVVGGDGLRLEFEEKQRAVTPGQFAVLYDGETCLGGGVIEG